MDLDQLITTHRGPIERHLRRRVGDPVLAEDLAQEVFLRAWLHAPRDLSDERVRAWLFRVAGNIAIDALRARRAHVDPSVLDGIDAATVGALTDHDERLAIEAALARLPAKERALVTLQFAGYGPTDAARLLRTTPEAARKRLTRARERFRVVYTAQRPAGEAPLVLRDALATRMPVLGICRGHQLLNVVRGGTLHQDLSERPVASQAGHGGGTHAIDTRGQTVARRVLGTTSAVPSVHHQAIARVGRGLTVGAVSSDGVVESIEDPRLPFAVGTQWHAELPEAGEAGRRIRDALVEAAARHAGGAPLAVAA